jgi:hypothetical protein
MKATGPQKRRLWDLAVEVRRTVPGELTSDQAEALIAEFEKLPKLGALIGAPMVPRRSRKSKPERRVRQGRGYRKPVAT